jgi:TRAP-type C4-dicarboxylate transport system permease small subunit
MEKFVPGTLFVSIFFVMLMEIISRVAFRKSFEWNTEYCRYALVWITFLGTVYMIRENNHIAVTAVYDLCDRRNYRGLVFAMTVLRSLVSLLFWGILAWYGYKLASRTANFESSAMNISQFWLYICTSTCGVFAGIMELLKLFRTVRRLNDKDAYPVAEAMEGSK